MEECSSPCGGGELDRRPHDSGVASTAISPVTARRPLPSSSVTAAPSLPSSVLPCSCRFILVSRCYRYVGPSGLPVAITFPVPSCSRAMLSRESFRVDRNPYRDGPSSVGTSPSSGGRAVSLLSVRVYDRPELNVPNYYRPVGPVTASSTGPFFAATSCSTASASSATGPRRNAAHVHRRACARRGAMRRAYSTPPPKVRSFQTLSFTVNPIRKRA